MIDSKMLISDKAKIGKNVKIGHGTIIYDNVIIRDNSIIGPYCVIGEPKSNYYKNPDEHKFSETIIGSNSIVRSYSTIYEDVVIGNFFQSGHHIVIREESNIGHHTSFGSFSELPGKSKIIVIMLEYVVR